MPFLVSFCIRRARHAVPACALVLLAACSAEAPAPVVAVPEPVLSPEAEAARAAARQAFDEREQALVARFDRRDDGTAVDTESGLVWMRCSVGQNWHAGNCVGDAKQLSWNQAVKAVNGFSFAGFSDWRLPTRDELLTLTHCSSGRRGGVNAEGFGGSCEGAYRKPTILEVVFPNTPAANFWSSTPHEKYSYAAWGVAFANGATGVGALTEYVHLRLVRDAPAGAR